ncbi:uncharacterized protein CXQ87_000202 [Candidozyma duobushaemuli]|uniref:TATA-binding protein interacting (TIP20) domain-containing protein n=1 Tax=Candidozyma duobushaemuli TaxID=1231522 RepID=A0A2V1AHC8_9ASCO|nr:uncharacterized protein CXQ87_000202 [[Candida] duobushaemulonis]PVH17318.1 hypothetical protein CXQ87_000202 [[Candida] duobushaemulonis]
MSTFNIRQLEDSARDVDPDLRYMALEDFAKHLNNPKVQARNVSSFIPLLITLLNDSATEVQNQAVKSFAPLVRHIDDQEVLSVVNMLYDAVLKSSNTSKFSTSVPNLALRSIFNNSGSRFGKALARNVIDSLFPRLFATDTPVTIDSIEIIIDLIKALGGNLSANELSGMILSLVRFAYSESGIISKRAIVAVDYALDHVHSVTQEQTVRQLQFFDKVVNDIHLTYTATNKGVTAKNTQFTLLQVVLAKANKAKRDVFSEVSASIIFSEISTSLKLDSLARSLNAEDLDVDVLVSENSVREDALITLSSLINCITYETFLHAYAHPVVEIVKAFIAYDPLRYDNSDDDIEDDESEIDFSDDEESIEVETAEDNDGLASKLRLQTIVLIKQMTQAYPGILGIIYGENLVEPLIVAIGDKNDTVSNEAIFATITVLKATHAAATVRSRPNSDISMMTESGNSGTPSSQMTTRLPPLLEDYVFNCLLTTKNIARVSTSNALIESMVRVLAVFLSPSFLENLSNKFEEFKLTLKTNPDLIKLYKVILKTYTIEDIPPSFLDSSLMISLTYYSFISDILTVCNVFYPKVAGNQEYVALVNNTLFTPIAEKINVKQYSSDVRQHSLNSLTELIVNLDVSENNLSHAIDIYKESMNYEVTVNFTIENLITICQRRPQVFDNRDLCNLVVAKLNSYLSSSDSSLYVNSLILLDAIFVNTLFKGEKGDLQTLTQNVFHLLSETNDPNLINRAICILGHALNYIPADGDFFKKLINQVINIKWIDEDDVELSSLEYLINQVTKKSSLSGQELYDIGLQNLVLRNFLSAKVLAIITLDCDLNDRVSTELDSFSDKTVSSSSFDKIVFDIQYLGCIGEAVALTGVTFDDFFSLMISDNNDILCLAAARAVGLCIKRDVETYLPVLLKYYHSSSQNSEQKGSLVLVAIKQLMKGNMSHEKQNLLSHIWHNVSELKLAGEVLAKICEFTKSDEYQNKLFDVLESGALENSQIEHAIYTVVVITKQLINDSESQDLNVQLVEEILRYLSKPNLELKQAIVSTLLTGIHNKSLLIPDFLNNIILPSIYEELDAKEEFKKVIPMGPYKYVVDEGLEVRKLCYELINAIINIDNERLMDKEGGVNQTKMFEVLSVKGLNDTENSIVIMAIQNLLQIVSNDENVLHAITNQQEMISALTKVINKKLRSKASTQEAESQEESLRMAIKLSKVINNVLIHSNSTSGEWSSYFHELRNKHHLLFNAVELHQHIPLLCDELTQRLWAFVVALFVTAIERIWSVLDSGLYFVMNGILMALSFADALLDFSDRAVRNYELAKKVFKLSMYNSIN